ncbi:hypothetical protein NMG60_11004854 [Bertholletia excelsa]
MTAQKRVFHCITRQPIASRPPNRHSKKNIKIFVVILFSLLSTATPMEASSRPRSNRPVYHGSFQRSISPSGRFCSSSISSTSAGFASSISSFSSRPASFFNRSASPTRVNLQGSGSSSLSVRFSIDRETSPNRSIATCMCSPTTHPGSFRCSLHKNQTGYPHQPGQSGSCHSTRLNARRSAMTNSLVRIGTVEGDWVKRALTALIRPSSHHQRRRTDFQPRPSRLSNMSKAEDL